MPRALVAGCGYLGQQLADLLHAKGWMLEGWTRSAEAAENLNAKPYPVIPVDIGDREKINGRSENFDFVVHVASTRGGTVEDYRRTYREGVENLLDRFVGSTLLFTSSTSVYAQKDGEWVTEESPAEPAHERGKILREAEELVLGRGGIVARLAGIYGPGRSALLRKLLRGEATVAQDRFVNQVHRDDAAAALLLLLTDESSIGQVFNVCDDEPMLLSDCYDWLAETLDKPQPKQSAGEPPAPRKRGDSNKRVSNRKLRAAGWVPQYPSFVLGMTQNVLRQDFFGLARS